MTQKHLLVLLAVICLANPGLLFGQEQTQQQETDAEQSESNPETEQNSNEQSQQAQEGAQNDEQEQPPVTAREDTFIPSEEISEDAPVSFPVDI